MVLPDGVVVFFLDLVGRLSGVSADPSSFCGGAPLAFFRAIEEFGERR